MSLCDGQGSHVCSENSDDDSDGAEEGKWLGVTLGGCLFLMMLIWLIRTLASRPKRERLCHKIIHCCSLKSYRNTHEGHQTNCFESPSQTTTSNGESTDPSTNDVIYYTPRPRSSELGSLPPMHPAKRGYFGTFHSESDLEAAVQREDDGYDSDSVGFKASRSRQLRGLRKSRSAVAVSSIILEPIQEVDDNTDADSIHRLRTQAAAGEGARQQEPFSSARGSKSYPASLAALALVPDIKDSETDGHNGVLCFNTDDKSLHNAEFTLDMNGIEKNGGLESKIIIMDMARVDADDVNND